MAAAFACASDNVADAAACSKASAVDMVDIAAGSVTSAADSGDTAAGSLASAADAGNTAAGSVASAAEVGDITAVVPVSEASADSTAEDERAVASSVFISDAPAAAEGEDAPVSVVIVNGAGDDLGGAIVVAMVAMVAMVIVVAIAFSLSGCRISFLTSSIHLYAGCFSICRSRSAFFALISSSGRPSLR